MEKQELLDLVSEFVDRGGDTSDVCCNGWDKVDHIDMFTLSSIVGELIEQRFRKDVDGDLPVDYQFVDRNKGEFILYNNFMKYEASQKKIYQLATAAQTVAGYASNTAMQLMMEDD